MDESKLVDEQELDDVLEASGMVAAKAAMGSAMASSTVRVETSESERVRVRMPETHMISLELDDCLGRLCRLKVCDILDTMLIRLGEVGWSVECKSKVETMKRDGDMRGNAMR